MIQIAKAPSVVPAARRLGARAQRFALPAALLCGLGWAYARTLAPSITWANNGADSGDLVTAAATLGVPHASGYPTYILLARLFMLVPIGDLALRANLLSVAAALLAVLLLYLLVQRLAGAPATSSAPAAWLAALALGLAPLFWSQAIIAEVYALNAAFCAAILWFMARPARSGTGLMLQGIVVGLALGNHLTIGFFAVAWLGSVALASHISEPKPRPDRESQIAQVPRRNKLLVSWYLGGHLKGIGPALVGISAGLLVYLYVPLRAAAEPPVNWGGAQHWDGFWWLLSGALYRPLAFGLPAAQLGARVAALASLLVRQFGVAGLAVGCAGLVYGAPQARQYVRASVGLALAQTIFALGYNTADSDAYLLPALLIFALWIGLGVIVAFEALAARARWAAPLVAGLLAASLVWQAPASWRRVDASQDTRASEYAAQVLDAAPNHAIVVAGSDHDSFALWYAHFAQGRRPDTAVIVEPLLGYDWYRANVRAVYPDLRLPDVPHSDWVATLADFNPSRSAVCRTSVNDIPTLTCIGERGQ